MIESKVVSRLPEIIVDLPIEAKEGLEEGAQGILDEAQGRINTITGELEGSGSVESEGEGYSVQFDAIYAKWIEFGRKNAPPYPFLIPAAEAQAPEVLAKVLAKMRDL